MNPRIRLRERFGAINDQKCQRVVRIVAMLGQECSAEVTLHRNQAKRRLGLMMLEPACTAATEVAQPIEDHYAIYRFHGGTAVTPYRRTVRHNR